MSDKKVGFLSQMDCSYCSMVRDTFKKEIADGKIEEVLFDTQRGKELAKKLKATGTPTFFVETPEGVKSCEHTVSKDGKVSFECKLPEK